MFIFPGGVVRYFIASMAGLILFMTCFLSGIAGTLVPSFVAVAAVQVLVLVRVSVIPLAKFENGLLTTYSLVRGHRGPSPLISISTKGQLKKVVFVTTDWQYSSLLLVMLQKRWARPGFSAPWKWTALPENWNGSQERVAVLMAEGWGERVQ